ncbi:MAG: TldD/PmbA family protein [Labilithrix sp.]|nr:TldD/PmbA family protein [Labilithrix sp.]MBX3223258.1 TldD/PmbA family protein [Labilithrix sp.]
MAAEDTAVLATRALGIALDVMKRDGEPDAEVKIDVRRRAAANVRFARNEPTTSGESDEVTVSAWVALGQRNASTWVNQTDDKSIAELAGRALAMAKLSPADPEKMPLLGPQTYAPVPSAFDDGLAAMGPKERAAIAARAVARGDQAKVRIAGFFEREIEEAVTQNSEGLIARHRETAAQYTVTARTLDGAGSGWGGREAFRAGDLEDEVLASTAIDKAIRSAGAKALPPGKYTVVLEPQAVFEMMAFLVGQMNQRLADEGRSFFAGKVGQKLFADFVSLRSDPADPLTPGAPFDSEGLALASLPWIIDGRVNKLAVSRWWAKKKGLEPTGRHSVFHLSGGTAESVDALVRGTKRGLLVTRFWYNRMLEPQTVTITGLTRDGVFAIEDGKVTGPVANFRYNESPVTVLKNVDAMTRATTRAVAYGGAWHVPALRTHEFTMASPSAAV